MAKISTAFVGLALGDRVQCSSSLSIALGWSYHAAARFVQSPSFIVPNGLEPSCPPEAGNATRTLAPAGDQDKLHADSADWGRSTIK